MNRDRPRPRQTEETTSIADLVHLVEGFLTAENARDWPRWTACLREDCWYQVVGSGTIVRGKQEYLRKMQATYSELPDWQFTTGIFCVGQGDGAGNKHDPAGGSTVMVEFDGHGSFSGEYKGRQYATVPLQLQAVCVFIVRDQKIWGVREYWDPVGFERQLRV